MRLWRAVRLAAVNSARFIVPQQHCDSILPNSMGQHGGILSLNGHSLGESSRTHRLRSSCAYRKAALKHDWIRRLAQPSSCSLHPDDAKSRIKIYMDV